MGGAIAQLASDAGWNVIALAGRNETRPRQLAERIGSPDAACSISDAAGAAGLVLLTVTDDAIEPLCSQLAEAQAFAAGSIVAHCSGALGSDILSSAKDACGCQIASMHPLTTFPTAAAAADKFAGTYCFCEGDAEATETLMSLASDIGGKPMLIKPEGKALYHAAAVMACNYLTALMDAAATLCDAAGIAPAAAIEAMSPLARATLENVTKLGTREALTGPIARGDAQTVARHIEAMSACDEDLQAFYRIAGKWTLQLAKLRDTRDRSGDDAIAALLDT